MPGLPMVRAAGVARNPNANIEVLLRLVHSGVHTLQFAAIYRPNLPAAVYDAIVAHSDPQVRSILADCWNAPADQRARLAGDPDAVVRRSVAAGPHPFRMAVEPLPDETYAQLAGDHDVRVRIILAELWDLPETVRRRLVTDDEPAVRRAALCGWPTPPPDDVVDALLTDPDSNVARAARLARPETARAELTAGLGADFDLNRWADVARLGDLERLARVIPLDPDLALALVRDRRGEIRKAVAENAGLPPDLVAVLAVDPDPSVRLAVSLRPDLTEEERAAIDYEVRPEDRLSMPDWAVRGLDDLTLVNRCARSAHTGLRRFAACSPHLPTDLVAALAEDPDFAVRLLLCENHPAAPADLLLRTYLEARVITRGDLLTKHNFPHSGLARHATSADPKRRYLALLDTATTPEQVERLSRDEERHVRAAAASDARLTLARVRELLTDPVTAESAASNPVIPVWLMHEVLDEADVPIFEPALHPHRHCGY